MAAGSNAEALARPAADQEVGFLTGGEMGVLMRAHDWSTSPLGAPETWPQSLRSVVGLLLNSRFPMFVAWGGELGFLYNDAYAEILGTKHPGALGARFHDVWPEIWSDISPLVDAAMAGEPTYRENLPLVLNRKGYDEKAWFTFSYSPVRDESGQVAGMFCAVAETTAEVRAAKRRGALLELDERLRGVSNTAELSFTASELLGEAMGAARVGYGVIDADAGTILIEPNWSAPGFGSVAGVHRFCDFGTYIGDLRRGEPVAIGDVEVDRRTSGSVEKFRALGVRAFLDVPVVEQGRSVAMLLVHSATPRTWTEEEIDFVRDFAERTRAAIARRVAEVSLRDLNDTLEQRVAERTEERDRMWRLSQDLFLIIAPDGTIRAINPAVTALLGHKVEDLIGQHFGPYVHPDDVPATVNAIVRASAMPISDFETRLRAIDGAWHWFAWSAAPGDGIVYAVGRDVTAEKKHQAELEQAQEALRQSQKMEAVGQLVSGISHDFNNLLGAVVGSLDLIRRRADDPERVRRFAEAGLQAAERGSKLTAQLLTFSRSQRLELKPLLVCDVIEGVRDMLARTLGPMIELEFDLNPCPVPVLADATQVEMTILNLVINARDAMPDGGKLRIGTAPRRIDADPELTPGDYVELTVADTGIGMDEATLRRAMEPFYTTKPIGKGTGLGLAQVYGSARQAGGTARIESTPGEGTTVRVLLPRTDDVAHETTTADEATLTRLRSSAMVLIVDDDDDLRSVLVNSLDTLGYKVIQASDGPSGLAALEQMRPDVLVVDFAMPGMNGAEVAKAARERRPGLPVVLTSGYADTDAIENAVGKGAKVLRKPFRIDELLGTVGEALKNG